MSDRDVSRTNVTNPAHFVTIPARPRPFATHHPGEFALIRE
jgi:hypothetical protein